MEKFNTLYTNILKENYEPKEAFDVYLDRVGFFPDPTARKLLNILDVLGYRQGFQEFLDDNPGVIEKIVEFIGEWSQRNPEWQEAIQDALAGMEDFEENM